MTMRVPRSKVRYSLLFEALEAARWRGLSDRAYDALDIDAKARLIAHYRVHHQIEAVLALRTSRQRPPRA